MNSREPIVEVQDLTKVFDGVRAVDSISFKLYPGEIVALLGPNGAGKTTLIHMLLDLILPVSGRIRIFGLDLHAHRRQILSRMNFSSAYASLPLSLSLYENLHIFGLLYDVQDLPRKIERCLLDMDLWDLRGQSTFSLSSGLATRLNIAKSLLNDPELLLLDEPTTSMDPDIADKTRARLKAIQKERGMTILYSSHNMQEVERIADRILFLHKGRIVAEGTPQELLGKFNQADLEHLFLKIARGEERSAQVP